MVNPFAIPENGSVVEDPVDRIRIRAVDFESCSGRNCKFPELSMQTTDVKRTAIKDQCAIVLSLAPGHPEGLAAGVGNDRTEDRER